MIWRGVDLGHVTMTTLAIEGESGRKWYQDSARSIAAYAARHNLDAGVVCDVLSILSPRVSVPRSVVLADAYLRTGKSPGAMRQRLAALAQYRDTGRFNGPKVNAFASALRGDLDAVVVDAWMYRAARCSTYTPATYRKIAHSVRQAANGLGWPAAETQAAIWQGARTNVGFAEGYEPMTLERL